MTEDLRRTSVETDGGNTFERAREMLNAAGVDPDLIESVRVEIWHRSPDPDPEPDEEADGDGPEVETGPVEPEIRGHGKGGGPDSGYKGPLPTVPFEGEAVRPDTNIAGVIQALWSADDEWVRPATIDLNGIDRGQVSDALSSAFREGGYVDRRRVDPQPNKKGVQREYRINQTGKNALREGRRIAEEYRAEQRENQEREMAGE